MIGQCAGRLPFDLELGAGNGNACTLNKDGAASYLATPFLCYSAALEAWR